MDPWANIAKLTKEEVRQLQNKKLHSFINNYLYPFSPYYRKLLDDNKIDPKKIKSVDDLKRIPLTSKLDFVDSEEKSGKYKDFVQQPDEQKIKLYWPLSKKLPLLFDSVFKGKAHVQHQLKKQFRPTFMTFTTGTTNKPVPFLYTNYDIDNLHTSGARMLNLFDVPSEEYIVNMFPYAPHLAFWQVVCGGFESCVLTLSTGGGKVMGTEGNIGAIEKMKPSLLLGVPSYVYHVLRVAKEQGRKFDCIKKVVLGASKVTQGFKLKLADILESLGARDVAIMGTYGFTESRCAWGECPTPLDVSSGYFLYPDKEIFEVIDPKTGEVKGEGEDGELVYTSLDSRGSSMLRYRTGDFVKGGIVYEPSKHSRLTVPRISSDIVRLSDEKELKLSKIKGALVNLNHFSAILSDHELIEEWQIEIGKKNNDPYEIDEVILYVCAQDKCNKEQLAEEITKEIALATEVSPNRVEFIEMNSMVKRLQLETANKEKRILDSRPIG